MRRFRRTTLITAGCLSALAGLGLARAVSFLPADWLFIFCPLLILLKRKGPTALLLVILLGLGVGLWRGTIYAQKLGELRSLSGQQVIIQATATSDSVYSSGNQMEFTAGKAETIPSQQPLAGSFKISGFGVHMVYRGDVIRASGKLYPMRGSNQARIAYAQLAVVQVGHSWFNDLSRRFSAGMQNALPEPQSSFGMGLLIGQRINLPALVSAELVAVGLVHIVAVSGYNLTILIRGVQRLRLRSKYQQLAVSLALIGTFVTITGFSASIVRAALVSTLSLWAWYYGRRVKPAVLISFAAALTGLINPFYVWGDMSWYLSFLAFFGVMIIAPIIQARMFKKSPKILTSVLIETLSAELMTLPIIMLSFNQLSLVALLANVLIVPLVPVAMLLAAVAGTAGMLIPQVAGWFALPARLLLTYMLDIVHLLASIPSVLMHLSISVTYMLVFYIAVLVIILVAHKHIKNKKPADFARI